MRTEEKRCSECGDGYDLDCFAEGSAVCRFCTRKKLFADFARSCGLTRFPEPGGERYIYNVDGSFDGKKSECSYFMDELWNALVKIKGKEGDGLLLGEEES